MNFIKLSTSHEYLYSPKSWLHNQSSKMKIVTASLYFILLPAMSLRHISLFFFFLLILYMSIRMPRSLRQHFYATFTFFSFFLLISIQECGSCNQKKINNRKVFLFYILNNFYCLPLSVARFISIHFAYLMLVRCLLLTTNHKSIIEMAPIKRRYFYILPSIKFIFTITVSSQFLKFFFEEIKAMNASYALRSNSVNRHNDLEIILQLFVPFLKQFLANISYKIYIIASALYSRNITCGTLHTSN